jgi:hypothetical protein
MPSPIKISSLEIKDRVKSCKMCKFTPSECVLDPKSSKLVLDFKDLGKLQKVDLLVKRKSGNGTFQVQFGERRHSFSVLQTTPQRITVTGTGPWVEISRNRDSVGLLSLVGLEVFAEDESVNSMPDWKSIIKRCGKYSHLRMVGGELFAATGGYIEDKGRIVHLETDPPNMFVRESKKVSFVGSCKVTRIQLKENQPVVAKKPFVSNREAPSPAIAAPAISVNASGVKPVIGTPPSKAISEPVPPEISNSIVFNSIEEKSFDKYLHVKGKHLDAVRSDGKTLISLKNGAQCSFTINNLNDSTDYLCIVTGKALNGNGRLGLNFSYKEGDFSNYGQVTFSSSIFGHKYVSLKSLPRQFGKIPRLNLFKARGDIGQVLIERIIIIENVDIQHAKDMVATGHLKNFLGSGLGSVSVPIQVESDDKIYQKSKTYARYLEFKPKSIINKKGLVIPQTESGALWAQKMISMTNVKVAKKATLKSLAVGKPGLKTISEKVWLDHFHHESNLSLLKELNGKKIFTPSKLNQETIKSFCPDSTVLVQTKPLPWVQPKFLNLFKNRNYIVSFHRSKESTDRLIELWKDEYPHLVLVGVRGNFKSKVIPVNEYLSYDILVGILLQSQGVIDFDRVSDKSSGMVKLSVNLGIPTMTTSWEYFEDSNMFIPSVNGYPNASFLEEAYQKIKAFSKKEPQINKIKLEFEQGCETLLK